MIIINENCLGSDAVNKFVADFSHSGLQAKLPFEILLEGKESRVTKIKIPGIGWCMLKEMFADPRSSIFRHIKMWERMHFRPRFKRTFKVAAAARAFGISAYEPYAFWSENKGCGHLYFLTEFVEGESFENLCRGMHYSKVVRPRILYLFGMLGEIAAKLHRNGIINCDMIPRNCIITKDNDGKETLTLIDMDISYFATKSMGRIGFIQKMRSFRRFVSYYPLNNECLDAFLNGYSGGDSDFACRCRNVLEYFRVHPQHGSCASLIALFKFKPPRLMM